jgi:hypothetical protein
MKTKMKLDFWNNPIIVSAFRVKYRRGGLFNITAIYLLLLAGGGMALWYYYNPATWGPWPRNYLLALLAVQFVVSAIIAANATASSIRTEVANRTLDFQRIAALSPQQILLGKLLGEPALAYLLAIAAVPLTVYCWVLGVAGVSLDVMFFLYLNLATTTLLLGALGLLQRLGPSEKRSTFGSGGGAGWAILALVFVPQIIINARSLSAIPSAAAAVGLTTPAFLFYGIYNGNPWEYSLTFYGLQIPFLAITPVSQLFLAYLCFRTMVRRLVNPSCTSLSKQLACAVLIVVDVIAAAVLSEPGPLGLPFDRRCAAFCLVHLLTGFWLVTSVTPWRQVLESWTWRRRGQASRFWDAWLGERSATGLLLATFCIIGLLALVVLVMLPAGFQQGFVNLPAHGPVVVAMCITTMVLILTLGALYQAFMLLAGRGGTGVFATFVLIVMLPFHLFGGYYGIQSLLALAPSAHFAAWLNGTPPPSLTPLLVLYLGLLAFSWFAISRRLGQMKRTIEHKLRQMGVAESAS